MSNILIVENDNTVLNVVQPSLSAEGFELVHIPPFSAKTSETLSSSNGSESIVETIKSHQPEMILLSCAQDTDKIQAAAICRTLKSSADTDSIPVIFMGNASNTNNENLKDLLECGANDFIALDDHPENIDVRLQFILRYKRAMRHSEALAEQLNEVNDQIYRRNMQVEKDLYIARQLQQSLLPTPIEDTSLDSSQFLMAKCHYLNEKTRVSGIYVPCDALGGDLYDVMGFNDGSIGITVADVSGHGVPAGFITAIFKASFYRATHTFQSPGDILYHLNNELANIIKTGEYITAIYCRLEEDGQTLHYSGAGHPYPLHYVAATNTLEKLTENGPPLVWFPDMDYPVGTVKLAPGDKVLIYTDGISEMKDPNRELYGEERLEELFLKHAKAQTGGFVLEAMIQELSDYTQGHPLEDDMSMTLLEARD